MKNLKKIVIISLIAGLQSFALAEGPGDRGGGATHVCYDETGRIKSVELFDLYEAREALGYKLVDPTGKTANELLYNAMVKISKASYGFADKIERYLSEYARITRTVLNKEFDVIKDARIVFVDKNCEYKQIAQWKGRRISEVPAVVYINAELIDIFRRSNLNIAALALHEAIYAFQRDEEGEQYSDRARAIVAKSFSDEPLTELDVSMLNYKFHNIFPPNASYTVRLTAVKNNPSAIHIYTGSQHDKCEINAVGDLCELEVSSHKSFYYRFAHFVEDEKATVKMEVLKNGKPHLTLRPPGKLMPQQELITFGNGIVKEGWFHLFRSVENNSNQDYSTLYAQIMVLKL